MPLQATSGAASYDAFGGGVAAVPNYIEECFSTFLYQGNGSTQTINNGIDLAGKGGLVWIKDRVGAYSHNLVDSARGVNNYLFSDLTSAQFDAGSLRVSSFNADGFSLGSGSNGTNRSGNGHVSWTFRKQPKFFDVVTYTGNGVSGRTVAHNLGSVPGAIFIKGTSDTSDWCCMVRASDTTYASFLSLNTTGASAYTGVLGDPPTATQFTTNSLGNSAGTYAPNVNGVTYVAYLFAHNAGGFGLTGTDNVISCGSFTTDGSGAATVDLGYEPQWVMVKKTNAGDEANSGFWWMQDNMRGYPVRPSASPHLQANTSSAEFPGTGGVLTFPTSTGFVFNQNYSGFQNSNFIYIAIRRGPMRTPTTGTSVFGLYKATAATSPSLVSSFPVDMLFTKNPASSGYSPFISSRLTSERRMNTGSTDAEATDSTFDFDYQNGALSVDVTDYLGWMFRRAPGFFDVVCYTGTGSAQNISHNLTVVPELMIVKERNGANGWQVYSASLTNNDYLILNTTAGVPAPSTTRWNSTTPTSTVFSVGTHGATNGSGQNFVAYLFASCPGVSKVGSYTGTGTTQTINCGFTAGSRFVLIKRTDSTGDWYVWDSARGIVAGNDPYLLLNSTAAEVTNTDFIDTAATGFEISSTAPAAINASGGTYIFLAIA